MTGNPLDDIPAFNRITFQAVLTDGTEDPADALAAAGIFDPVTVPISPGDEPDQGSGIIQGGPVPNLTAVLEEDEEENGGGGHDDDARERQAPRDRPVGRPTRQTAVLPAAFGQRPLAPVRI